MQPPDRPTAKRVEWVDTAKGFATFLVIVGHVVPGLINGGVMPNSPEAEFLNRWIYSFHMPMFFLLGGLFAMRSARRSTGEYVVDKLKVVLYPYVVWTLIQVLVMSLGRGATNHQAPPLTAAAVGRALLVEPVMEFWFLHALFLILMTFLLVIRWKPDARVFLGVSLAILALDLLFESALPKVVVAAAFHMPFFALGVLLSDWIRQDLTSWATGRLAAVATVTFGLVTAGVAAGFRTEEGSPQRFALAVVGILGGLAVSILIDRTNGVLARVVRQWGEYSLPIFLIHVIVGGGLRIILSRKLGFTDPTGHVVLGIVAALYVPIAVAWVCSRIGFRYAFTFGK